MAQRDVTERAGLARWLQPSVPAIAERLADSAAETDAPDQVMRMLNSLPPQESYRTCRSYQYLQDLWRALGGGTEDIEHRA
jgi:hypothetical protein